MRLVAVLCDSESQVCGWKKKRKMGVWKEMVGFIGTFPKQTVRMVGHPGALLLFLCSEYARFYCFPFLNSVTGQKFGWNILLEAAVDSGRRLPLANGLVSHKTLLRFWDLMG